MPKTRGVVLIIDDADDGDGRTTKRLLSSVMNCIVRHPNDVVAGDLRRAKLVLVDFRLTNWPDRDNQKTPSLKPRDGIALIAVLRSNLPQLKASPVAFALNSGMLIDLNGGRPSAGREHAIAQSVDLEWVFAKGAGRENFLIAVKSLTEAVAALPARWPTAVSTRNRIQSLLAVPTGAKWSQSAIEALDRSYPPHDIMIGNGSGIAVLRWLLHVILPYPTFLLDQRYLAARLNLEPRSFSELLRGKEGSAIRRKLSSFEYKGILKDFSGPRWWRPGLEQWIWERTKGRAFDRESIHGLVRSTFSKSVEFTTKQSPVVCLDDELRPTDDLIELASSVEVKPDGWPSFAESARIPATAADDPNFAALVPQSEKNKL